MELTFLRHAESEFNHLGIFQGRLNCNLSQKGINETIEKAKDFDSSIFDVCFSSPLIRTLQTTRILVPYLPTICDERIIERNLGDWQNTPITEEKLYLLNRMHQTPPNGESTQELIDRVQDFIDYLKANFFDKKVLVITHSGIIHATQMLLGLEVTQIDNLETLTVSFNAKRLIKK